MFCKQDENSTSSCDRVSPRVKAALAICHELPNAGAFRSLRLQICTNTIGEHVLRRICHTDAFGFGLSGGIAQEQTSSTPLPNFSTTSTTICLELLSMRRYKRHISL